MLLAILNPLRSAGLWLVMLTAALPAAATAMAATTQVADWQQVVRSSPYWISQGAFGNLATIRRWVLTGTGFCENRDRHILFDRRARFLGYFSNLGDGGDNQARLNDYRAQLVARDEVEQWAPGSDRRIGYPFALNCDQPDARLDIALQRFTGQIDEARLWGTWDGLRIGSPKQTVPLHEALLQVHRERSLAGRVSLPEEVLGTLAGKVLIESGGRARAHSAANAKGIMQLAPAALRDCGLRERYHFHRLAQIDCAFKLLEHNHRLIEPAFQQVFGHLPEDKAEELYAYLVLQAYHGGATRVRALLLDPELNGPAQYFARHHTRFSAGDIALGMVFHNLGRNRLGFASLYYVVDVGIAKQFACRALRDLPGCDYDTADAARSASR